MTWRIGRGKAGRGGESDFSQVAGEDFARCLVDSWGPFRLTKPAQLVLLRKTLPENAKCVCLTKPEPWPFVAGGTGGPHRLERGLRGGALPGIA